MSLRVPRWVLLLWLAGVCSGVQVFVRDEKRFAVLFQAVVLPCHYTSVSSQTPVVQWVYKSYCRDRTRDTFGFSDSGALGAGLQGVGGTGGGGGGGGRGGYDGGVAAVMDYLDCADSSRTVRTVASIAGSSVTLSEYYKNRDISIINKADLRIGEVQWGDSGVYICKVVISDDLEGQSEANVELLVLGFSGDPEDLLPGFDMKIMPEWVFVGAVALGSVLVLLLLGVCWCQCCPHSCCCYVSCWCCPETCCCPRHLYEAGKGIKVGTPTPQVTPYPPYFISGVPTMMPITPPSLVDKASPVPPSDSSLLASVAFHGAGTLPYRVASTQPSIQPSTQDQNSLRVLQYVEKQLAHFSPTRPRGPQSSSLSELSSLHEGEAGFRQTYRDIQKNALPAIPDRDPALQSGDDRQHQRSRSNRSPELQRYPRSPPAPQRYRDDFDNPDDDRPLPPRRYSDDPPSSPHTGRSVRKPLGGREQERWNPRSEHLQRKAFHSIGPTGSLDELERDSYRRRGEGGRPGDGRHGDEEDAGDRMELREFRRQLSAPHRECSPRGYRDGRGREEEEEEEEGERPRRERKKANGGDHISPLASPTRRRGGSWDGERHPAPPLPRLSPPSSCSREGDYDGTFLSSLLERKARLRGTGPGRGEQDSDPPSKGSSKQSSGESGRYRSRSPNGRREGESASPYPERERAGGERGGGSRGAGERGGGERGWAERGGGERASPRPASSQTSRSSALAPSSRREEPRDKARKTNMLLSRDSLIV